MVNVNEVRVGFIGCGRVAENHFEAIRKCENVRLIAVSDINEELAMKRAQQWGVVVCSPYEIYKRNDIDAIFVLTPFHTHFFYTFHALKEGKHVLVEKPVSMDPEEISQMAKVAQQVGRICMPGHSYIYLRELRRFKEIISSGSLGEPFTMFSSEIYYMPEELIEKYNGPLQEVLWHHIYLMIAYMGLPSKVCAVKGCFRKDKIPTGDEHLMVVAEFESGALAHIYLSWATEDETSDPWTFKIKVLCQKGGLHFSRKDIVKFTPNRENEYPLYQEMFDEEVDYFINQCIRKGKKPLSDLYDAYYTSWIINKIKEAVEEERVLRIDIKEIGELTF
ncbi:oxidoreductase domain containing protein [Caldicellulosiruptor saccharolyticus DSM 8903]|uniref:Oxidoreductase domain containing protein n=1 Tax=Caldicellulosiruptor saccharolyticus (strain ATCC 43494 / DSM 8903 / Tp8T 6331) TaxID=351627 RepID=A4XN17_CALS8|nr:Gfo/Idh/MocA family oxidoreductase [Caldicellulosiruptor saccharolyticus]ABP68302.1 oxidoreductase domain containing protein [Caldicellulosiruptor saccharolyticus DSM 8903]